MFVDFLCYLPLKIFRIVPIYYHCIHSFIRGCEKVFVSNNRLLFLMCKVQFSNCSFHPWKEPSNSLRVARQTPDEG